MSFLCLIMNIGKAFFLTLQLRINKTCERENIEEVLNKND